MTNQEADALRKSFIESDLFAYYEKYGNYAATYANNAARMKHSAARKMGIKGGVGRGKQWKEMIKNNDPRITAHYKMRNLKSQEYFSKNPEARKYRSEQQTIGFNKFIKDLKESGEYKAWKKISTDKFSKWAKDNPEDCQRRATIAGKESIRKRKLDPVKFKADCSSNGKKGMAGLQKLYKENPELKKKNIKIACDAASKKNHEYQEARTKECVKIFIKIMPKTFTREDIKMIKKKYKLTWRAITKVIEDPTLVSSEMFRPCGLKGKGGKKLIFHKLF